MKTLLNNKSCMLAIDAGGTSIKGALVSFQQQISNFFEVSIAQAQSAEETFAAFTKAAEQGTQEAKGEGLRVKGIGIGIPGPFDYKKGISLMDHKYQKIKGLSLIPSLQRAVPQVPIHFMHDSSAFLLGELVLHPRREEKDICAVLLGTGLGFACTQKGLLFENEEGGPGISIFKRPYKNKTAEEFVSARGIVNTYRLLGGKGEVTVKDIANRAYSEDRIAKETFYETAIALAKIMAPILQENEFGSMLLGGQISKTGSVLLNPIAAALKEMRIACKVEKAKQIDHAGYSHFF